MEGALKIGRVQLIVLVVFVFFKVIRPGVLASNSPEVFKLFLLSFPNFCEGIIGVSTVTFISLYLTRKLKISDQAVYVMATLLATVYVITQEVKIHNLGGKNVYDLNDVLFSIAGLVVGYFIINRIKPTLRPTLSGDNTEQEELRS